MQGSPTSRGELGDELVTELPPGQFVPGMLQLGAKLGRNPISKVQTVQSPEGKAVGRCWGGVGVLDLRNLGFFFFFCAFWH